MPILSALRSLFRRRPVEPYSFADDAYLAEMVRRSKRLPKFTCEERN